MRRLFIFIFTVSFVLPLHSQTINFSSVKVKTKSQSREYSYDQFVMLNYGAVACEGIGSRGKGGNVLGIQYGQVHIGGWYVSADMALSPMHFSHDYHFDYYGEYVDVLDHLVSPHYIDGKVSFNRISFGGGGIVRMVIPLYFYLGFGYLYQNLTTKSEVLGWIEYNIKNRYSPHSSGYAEFGLQGNIKGFTMRTGFRYNFCRNLEFSVGFGVTFARQSKKLETKTNE